MANTPKQQLLEDRLGEPLPVYLLRLRQDDRSWRWIARKVTEETGVQVSHHLLRVALKESA